MEITKEDLIRTLEGHEAYKRALKMVDDKEAEVIKKSLASFMEQATQALLPLIERMEGDEEFAKAVRDRLRGAAEQGGGVVIGESPAAVSGSKAG